MTALENVKKLKRVRFNKKCFYSIQLNMARLNKIVFLEWKLFYGKTNCYYYLKIHFLPSWIFSLSAFVSFSLSSFCSCPLPHFHCQTSLSSSSCSFYLSHFPNRYPKCSVSVSSSFFFFRLRFRYPNHCQRNLVFAFLTFCSFCLFCLSSFSISSSLVWP